MTATIDHAAFIRASEAEATGITSPLKRAHRRVLEQPGDDAARLWYADELDAVGEGERAEFIRNQCGPKRNLIATAEPRDGAYVIHGRNGDTVLADALEETVRDLPAVKGTRLVWERGFVSRIICSLAAFMGGECIRCRGRGRLWVGGYENRSTPIVQADEFESCKPCQGTGRTPGLVDTIFSEQPIESVTITDREPSPDMETRRFSWWRKLARHEDEPQGIEAELWDEIESYIVFSGTPSLIKWFPTREAALLALSAACVSLGRRRAGLPELKPMEVTG